LGALRWLLEGKYLQREKESGEGVDIGGWLFVLVFLAGLVVKSDHAQVAQEHTGLVLTYREVYKTSGKFFNPLLIKTVL
jgi:hypothetical protein